MSVDAAAAAARFFVGIDLGTTHTVVAYSELGAGANADAVVDGLADESPPIRLFEIDQLVAPGQVAARALLPSVRYQAALDELAAADLRLPWNLPLADGVAPVVIGELALRLGAQVPGRLVASAKSWLSHASVDRTAPILPWGADDGSVVKVSPLAASASYLAHVRSAWNARFAAAPLERQRIVLTVPASFDDGARALTLEAARLAGLPAVHLLEEPQAALYDWLSQHRDRLGAELAQSRLVLVCDVGGGTTDLSLIAVALRDGEPQLTRVAVGEHLMLGGDNMDLALAHAVERRLLAAPSAAGDGAGVGAGPGAGGSRLSAAQMSQLLQRCRAAKERLLAADAPESVAVTLLGAGSRLVGATRSAELTRGEVDRLLVDGFFPPVDADALPQRRRGGIVEFGLPYASDPAITRHLAAFLQRHAAVCREALGDRAPVGGAPPLPDTLLLNGGVFRAAALARRLAATLAGWSARPPTVLHNAHLDAAVARGAVAYALARDGRGPRIGGGSARSYFLVLGGDGGGGGGDRPAVGRAVCVLPRGTETGRRLRLADRSFRLRLGQPVVFDLLSSASHVAPRPGELIELIDPAEGGDFIRLPPLTSVIGATTGGRPRAEVTVQLESVLTEVGTLQLTCVGLDATAQHWQLEFEVRGRSQTQTQTDAAEEVKAHAAPAGTAALEPPHPRLPEAIDRLDRVFGERSQAAEAKDVRQLRQQLERLLGERESWRMPLLRELFAALWERRRRRRRSAVHERVWFNLAGYCLRPGFGSPLDAWRIEQLASLFEDGLQHTHDSQLWSEWWTLWRRIAAGLTEDRQLQILNDLAYELQPPGAALVPRPPGPRRGGYDDMVRLAASLEQVGVEHKIIVGDWLLERLRRPSENVQGWWAVGRLGARQPFSRSVHQVVPVATATAWLKPILELDWHQVEPAAFAAAQIARMTGDRTRDLADDVRAEVVRRLAQARVAPRWIMMVREVTELDTAAQRQVFGEALPPGLRLID